MVLVILMTLESAVVVLALVFKSEWENKASELITERLQKVYGDSLDDSQGPFTRTFNKLQDKLSCCGWAGPSDYSNVDRYHWNTTLDNGMTRTVPDQCCKQSNSTEVLQCVVQPYNSSDIFQQGCQDALATMIHGYQWSIFGIAVFLLLFQFVMMILTLASVVHNGKVKYEVREVRA
ncbi:tetraspanin [Plakobranchus ocellatus]|uniref:Tetraspanin n=1 Tax=Plakobranchus ocellatus TaxID=259542 RepID=A0AAV4B9C8_9GAST|nr:tetraspanin [Plakobranchus ocellatus]